MKIKGNSWKEQTHRGPASPPSVCHLLTIHWGSPHFQENHHLQSIRRCNRGDATRHGAHFRGARCGLNYISSSCFYKVSDSSPRSQCWSSDRAESDCRQAGRLIWPQNHKLSLTLNGPQQEGKSNQNMKSTPRAAVSSL